MFNEILGNKVSTIALLLLVVLGVGYYTTNSQAQTDLNQFVNKPLVK